MSLAINITLYIFYVCLFLWLIRKWRFFQIEEMPRNLLPLFFLIKAAAGLGITLVYTYYYSDQSKSDIYHFFNDSTVISSVLFTDPKAWLKIMSGFGLSDPDAYSYLVKTWYFWKPAGEAVTNNTFIIRIISIINYLTNYSIYTDTLFFSFLSFIGLTALFKVFSRWFSGSLLLLAVLVFLLPSLLFWASGLLKESLLVTGIGLYLYGWFRFNDARGINNLLLIALGLFIVGLTKNYVAVIMVGSSLFLPMSGSVTRLPYPLLRRIVLFSALALTGIYFFGEKLGAQLIERRNEFISLAISEKAGSAISEDLMVPNAYSLLEVLPSALINALFRPFIWNGGNIFQLLFALENAVVWFVIIAGLIFFFKKPEKEKLWMCLFCITFSTLNYMVIGVTIPVIGALVHYRCIAMLFLLLAVLWLVDSDKLKQRLPLLVKF